MASKMHVTPRISQTARDNSFHIRYTDISIEKVFFFPTTQAEVWDNLWKCGGICELWCEKRRNNGDNGTLGSRLLGNTHVGPNLALESGEKKTGR